VSFFFGMVSLQDPPSLSSSTLSSFLGSGFRSFVQVKWTRGGTAARLMENFLNAGLFAFVEVLDRRSHLSPVWFCLPRGFLICNLKLPMFYVVVHSSAPVPFVREYRTVNRVRIVHPILLDPCRSVAIVGGSLVTFFSPHS